MLTQFTHIPPETIFLFFFSISLRTIMASSHIHDHSSFGLVKFVRVYVAFLIWQNVNLRKSLRTFATIYNTHD